MGYRESPLAEIEGVLRGKQYRDAQGRDYSFLMMRRGSEGYIFNFQKGKENVDLSLNDLLGLERITVSKIAKKPSRSR